MNNRWGVKEYHWYFTKHSKYSRGEMEAMTLEWDKILIDKKDKDTILDDALVEQWTAHTFDMMNLTFSNEG